MSRRLFVLAAAAALVVAVTPVSAHHRDSDLLRRVAELEARVAALEAGGAPSPTPTPSPVSTPAPTATPSPPPSPSATTSPAANVRDFGATGNGTTNDTAAFNAAQTAALAGSGIVYVPVGTYAITSFRPAAGITLRGEDRFATVIRRFGLGPHAGPGLIHVTAAGVTVETLTIRGTGRRLTTTTTGTGDDILVNVIDGADFTARRLSLVDAQGIGIQIEGPNATRGTYEDITITNTYVRDNGYHGVGLWLYRGPHHNAFRAVTVDGADYAGVMLDAGTTGTTNAAGADDNTFADIVIRNAARYQIANGGVGAGWMWTGGARNTVTRYTITDIPQGAALAFGVDQSGIGSTANTLTTGVVERVASGIVFAFNATGNTINGGTGAGRVTGTWSGNTFLNWPGLVFG